jgi:hypothetical protein
MRKLYIPILLLIVLAACRKDRLDGEFETIAGKWRWIYLIDSTASGKDTLHDYEVAEKIEWEFLQKGRYKILNDGKKVESGYITTSHDFTTNAPVISLKKGGSEIICTVYFHGNDTIELRIPRNSLYTRRWHVRE